MIKVFLIYPLYFKACDARRVPSSTHSSTAETSRPECSLNPELLNPKQCHFSKFRPSCLLKPHSKKTEGSVFKVAKQTEPSVKFHHNGSKPPEFVDIDISGPGQGSSLV